jgi:carbonic anhydrase
MPVVRSDERLLVSTADLDRVAAEPSRRELLGATLMLSGGLVAASAVGVSAFGDAAAAAVPDARFPKSPEAALRRLMAGNARFAAGEARNPRRGEKQRVLVSEGQKPFAAVLACADSRVPPELIFDQGLGDLFVIRIAGNTATDPFVIGSFEYAIEHVGVLVAFVLGHSDCGAVKAAIETVSTGVLPPDDIAELVIPIIPAVEAVEDQPKDELLDAAIEENVKLTTQSLSDVPVVHEAVAAGSLLVAGGEYELASGKVELVA